MLVHIISALVKENVSVLHSQKDQQEEGKINGVNASEIFLLGVNFIV